MATKKTTTKNATKYVAKWNSRVNGKITQVTAIVTKKGSAYVDAEGKVVPEWADIKPVS